MCIFLHKVTVVKPSLFVDVEKVATLIVYVVIGIKHCSTVPEIFHSSRDKELSPPLICLIGSVSINSKRYCRKIDNIHQGPSNNKPYDMYGHIV